MVLSIRTLSDQFRHSVPLVDAPNRLVITEGLGCRDIFSLTAILALMKSFEAFTPDNDPHGKHDLRALDHIGERYFWKID